MKFCHFLRNASLASLRLLLAVWVGAAVLFVITSVAEQTAPEFESVTRDQLATIRFPLYYAFGSGIYGLSALALAILWCCGERQNRRRTVITTTLICVSALVFAYDYFMVYRPLQQLIIPPGSARNEQFMTLHKASEYANTIHVLLMLVAAAVVSWPRPPAAKTDSQSA